MLHILGMIGKGMGITLLGIFVMLALLLFAALFVPIRYSAKGYKEREGAPSGKAALSWLLHIVSFHILWEGKLHYRLRIFGIPVYDDQRSALRKEKGRKKEKKPKQKKAKQQKGGGAEVEHDSAGWESGMKQDSAAEPEDMADKQRNAAMQKDSAAMQKDNAAPARENTRRDKTAMQEEEEAAGGRDAPRLEQEREKTSFFSKIIEFCSMLKGLFCRLLDIPRRLAERIKRLEETAAALKAFLETEELKRSLSLGKKQLMRLWRHIRPGKLKADVHFGFEDPYTTGQVLAAMGMLYPLLGKGVVIRPDFEETVWEGELSVKGRIRIFFLLRVLWILYFDKDIKRLIHMWKKEEA